MPMGHHFMDSSHLSHQIDEFAFCSRPSVASPLPYLFRPYPWSLLSCLSSAEMFASTVICSADAKERLLRHEVYHGRVLRDMDLRGEA